MKVDGKEFLRNVSIEQDKARLSQEQQKLDEQKRQSVRREPEFFEPEDDAAYLDLSLDDTPKEEGIDNNILNDIRLNPDSNENNKKRYIILGFGLILLFIITIVIVRVISNSSEEEKLQPTKTKTETVSPIKKDQQLDKINTNDDYQKIIDQKDDYIKRPVAVSKPKVEKKDIILPEPVKEEAPVVIEKQTPANPPRDLFGLEKEAVVQQPVAPKVEKKVVKQQVPIKKAEPKKVVQSKPLNKPKRKIVVEPAKETNFVKKKQAKVSGYYIQIGSFTKKPQDKYLNNIERKGYSYTVHAMNIKGTRYNKILVGPFPSRNVAKSRLTKVRKDLKAPGAYILKF